MQGLEPGQVTSGGLEFIGAARLSGRGAGLVENGVEVVERVRICRHSVLAGRGARVRR